MYEITNEDLNLILHQSASPTPKLLLEVLDENQKVVETITTLVSANLNINSESDIRRKGTFTVQPTPKEQIKLHPNNLIWLNKDLRFKVGLYNIRERQYKYYTLAYMTYDDASFTYDATTNQISFNCSDFISKLDGTKNGQLGALTIKFPAYEEADDGNVTKHNTIRDAVITTLEELANITSYRIDDIGEYNAIPEYNDDWESYRQEHETWNVIPYDEEFSCGCSILSILTTFRDLYPNYEMFFDPFDENRFICQLIPFCYEDDIIIDNQFLQKVFISENSSIDMSSVRNICEVWGKIIETKFYTETCTYSDNTYSCTVTGFDTKYYNSDTVSIKIPKSEQSNDESSNESEEEKPKIIKLNINNLGAINIYEESTDKPIDDGILNEAVIYSFKIKKVKVNDEYIFRAYLLGQWQAHAIDVLSSELVEKNDTLNNAAILEESDDLYNTISINTRNDEENNEPPLYSREYFQEKYNCENVNITIIPNSPFTVQELGEILDVKTGGEYENITSDSLALERAVYENWKNSRLTDQITITTLLLPFLDVNIKVSYKPKNCEEERQYIIKSVSHDFAGFTSTISMYRFYPSYKSLMEEAGLHNTLIDYSHNSLSKYTNDELKKLISKGDLI